MVNSHFSLASIINRLRHQLLANTHTNAQPSPWRHGEEVDDLEDSLRTIISYYMYWEILKNSSTEFITHLYVPEVDPVTSVAFREQEDHAHLLKRIGFHIRDGGPEGLNLTAALSEVLQDPCSGLTERALKGYDKQSVPDAERLLSYAVSRSLHGLGYPDEANFINIIAQWHESSDGAGLSQLERSKYNYQMLSLILDQWMPWHRQCYDFNFIDINR